MRYIYIYISLLLSSFSVIVEMVIAQPSFCALIYNLHYAYNLTEPKSYDYGQHIACIIERKAS